MLPKHGGSFLSVCCCSPRAGSISVAMSRDSPGVTAALRAGASVWRPSYDRGSFVWASRADWLGGLTSAHSVGVLRVSPAHLPRPLPEPSNGVSAVARIGAADHAAILIGDGAATAPTIGTIPPPGVIVSWLISYLIAWLIRWLVAATARRARRVARLFLRRVRRPRFCAAVRLRRRCLGGFRRRIVRGGEGCRGLRRDWRFSARRRMRHRDRASQRKPGDHRCLARSTQAYHARLRYLEGCRRRRGSGGLAFARARNGA